jgi:hypothetical protein
MMVRLKRNMERIMSICLTWFPISGLGKPKLYQNLGDFTRIGDFTWRVSEMVSIMTLFDKTMKRKLNSVS